MAVHLVLAQPNLLAMLESGNIWAKRLLAWSQDMKAKLCLTTNIDHLVSASMTPFAMSGLKNDATDCVAEASAANPLCFLPFT